MSDLTGKTIQIPADLWGGWTVRGLRADAEYWGRKSYDAISLLLNHLADEIERQKPTRMDEPDEFGAMVEAATAETGRERWLCGEPTTTNGEIGGKRWWRNEHADIAYWSDLIDPRLVGGAS